MQHPYIPATPDEQREMLAALGADSADRLFDGIPEALKLKRPLDLPGPMAEQDLAAHLRELAAKNRHAGEADCFLGAGAYDHYIPAVVDALAGRQEFYTAYTPYQPEISQGTLQAIFEYQSLICSLTGMDVANASLYDGATAAAEAAAMACQATRRNEVLVARSLHPQSRSVLETYARFNGIKLREIPWQSGLLDFGALEEALSENTAAVLLQSPNFLGMVEDVGRAAELAHSRKALLAVSCDPISLALLKSPGELGADIVIGEGQAMGSPLSYGGPYLGFFAAKEALTRKMPGRIVGETTDHEGRRGFVLTIQTREQHIRREKATSNICSNQALMALRATIYLAALGRQGLKETAQLCLQKAHYAREALLGTGRMAPLFEGENAPFFKEFPLAVKGDPKELLPWLLAQGILGGYPLGGDYPELATGLLVAVTEQRSRAQIDRFAEKVVAWK